MDEETAHVFETPRSRTTRAILLFLGGVLLFSLALVISTVGGLGRPTSSVPIFRIVPSITAAGMIGTAIFMVRHSQRVSLTRHGLTVDGALGRRFIAWTDLRHARVGSATSTMGQSTMPVLELFDTEGRLVARLGG